MCKVGDHVRVIDSTLSLFNKVGVVRRNGVFNNSRIVKFEDSPYSFGLQESQLEVVK